MFKGTNNWRRVGVFTVNFEHILRFFSSVLLLTLSKQMLAGLQIHDAWNALNIGLTETEIKNGFRSSIHFWSG